MRKLGVTILILLVGAACGGGEDASSSDTSAATTTTTVGAVESADAEWAATVGEVLEDLIAAQRVSTNAFIEVFEPGPAEVTAIRDLFQRDAATLAAATGALPPSPDDPALAVSYDPFRAALEAESAIAADIAAELTDDHDALRAEVEANNGNIDGTRYGELRSLFGPFVDARIDTCFGVQAAVESAGLQSITCIDDAPVG
jgi:ABC-type glycerol-3-phosphate transport system substrate-binding protein